MKKVCVFCGKSLKYGNNAMPVMEGYCCDTCNFAIVIPERIRLSIEQLDETEAFDDKDDESDLYDDSMIVSDLSGIVWGVGINS